MFVSSSRTTDRGGSLDTPLTSKGAIILSIDTPLGVQVLYLVDIVSTHPAPASAKVAGKGPIKWRCGSRVIRGENEIEPPTEIGRNSQY